MKKSENPLFTTIHGAFSTVRACKFCKHTDTIRAGVEGVGRGYGLSEGNKARGRMIQHVKAIHPDEYQRHLEAERQQLLARKSIAAVRGRSTT